MTGQIKKNGISWRHQRRRCLLKADELWVLSARCGAVRAWNESDWMRAASLQMIFQTTDTANGFRLQRPAKYCSNGKYQQATTLHDQDEAKRNDRPKRNGCYGLVGAGWDVRATRTISISINNNNNNDNINLFLSVAIATNDARRCTRAWTQSHFISTPRKRLRDWKIDFWRAAFCYRSSRSASLSGKSNPQTGQCSFMVLRRHM